MSPGLSGAGAEDRGQGQDLGKGNTRRWQRRRTAKVSKVMDDRLICGDIFMLMLIKFSFCMRAPQLVLLSWAAAGAQRGLWVGARAPQPDHGHVDGPAR